ncbi:hypothetical protein [Bacteroides heparinolyticus]|nr:hypothetical protein [Bacteroides heparinolyticus]
MDIEETDLFSFDSESDESNYGFGDFVRFLNRVSLGLFSTLNNIFEHEENVKEIKKEINGISRDFDPKPYLETAFASKKTIIKFVKSRFITELIEPLQLQIEEIRSKKYDKEKELEEARKKQEEMKILKEKIMEQLEVITQMKQDIA